MTKMYIKNLAMSSEELVTRYANGQTPVELSQLLGCHQETIKNRLRKVGFKLKSQGMERRHTCNDHYFDHIDTQEKAYWLGLLLADGSTRRRGNSGQLRLSLATEDLDHLIKFKKTISFDGPIRESHAGVAFTMEVTSSPMVDALERLECRPNKTCNHGTPVLSSELYRHFYRGYSDGDGCFCVDKQRQWHWYVVGHAPFLETLQQWMLPITGMPLTKISMLGAKVAGRIGYGGNRQVQRIAQELYRNADVWLDRKYRRIRHFIGV